MDKTELKNLFQRHAPSEEEQDTMEQVRAMTLKLAGTYMVNSPGSAEQTICLRKLSEALMYFNLAVCMGKKP